MPLSRRFLFRNHESRVPVPFVNADAFYTKGSIGVGGDAYGINVEAGIAHIQVPKRNITDGFGVTVDIYAGKGYAYGGLVDENFGVAAGVKIISADIGIEIKSGDKVYRPLSFEPQLGYGVEVKVGSDGITGGGALLYGNKASINVFDIYHLIFG